MFFLWNNLYVHLENHFFCCTFRQNSLSLHGRRRRTHHCVLKMRRKKYFLITPFLVSFFLSRAEGICCCCLLQSRPLPQSILHSPPTSTREKMNQPNAKSTTNKQKTKQMQKQNNNKTQQTNKHMPNQFCTPPSILHQGQKQTNKCKRTNKYFPPFSQTLNSFQIDL